MYPKYEQLNFKAVPSGVYDCEVFKNCLNNFNKRIEILEDKFSDLVQNLEKQSVASTCDTLEPYLAPCHHQINKPDWLVIQKRNSGSLDFRRSWCEYKKGFGSYEAEFWIGLDNLYALTSAQPTELLIMLKDFNNVVKIAKYDSFSIGNELEEYKIKEIGSYNGTTIDGLTYLKGCNFHINNSDQGGWWQKYGVCESNLNGHYHSGNGDDDVKDSMDGINWYDFFGNRYSMKCTQMMIRAKQ